MDNSSNNSGWTTLVGFGLGLVAGYYANSNRGRELRNDAADYMSSQAHMAGGYVQHQANQASNFVQDKVNTVTNKGQNFLDSANAMVNRINETGKEYLSKIKNEAPEDGEIASYIEKEMNALKRRVERKMTAKTNAVKA